MASVKEQILEIEKGFWEQANDPEFYSEHIADNALTVMDSMGVIEKQQAVEMSAKAKPFQNVEMKDMVLKQIGPDCVALTYHGQGKPEGSSEPYLGSITSVYLRQDGHWKLAVTTHQPWDPKAEEDSKKAKAG